MRPQITTALPGSDEHQRMVKAIMRIEQVVTEALPETTPESVILHANAMSVVLGLMLGKLKSIELLDDVERLIPSLITNVREGVKIGEDAGRKVMMENFGGG